MVGSGLDHDGEGGVLYSQMNKVYRYTIPAILLGALLLAMVAFYNGYPLVFGDSASYIGSHDPRRTHWARPVFYSLFLLPFHLELSLWPAMAAQCLLMAHLIWLTQRVLCGHVNLAAYGLLMLWLTLCSDLPWLTAWDHARYHDAVGGDRLISTGFLPGSSEPL